MTLQRIYTTCNGAGHSHVVAKDKKKQLALHTYSMLAGHLFIGYAYSRKRTARCLDFYSEAYKLHQRKGTRHGARYIHALAQGNSQPVGNAYAGSE
eukprot:scaffold130636_cov39-Prasinocladus_malaysianus.AAC.1